MQVKKLDGELFKSLVIYGCENLKANYQYVDSLNVFPVPDGDTGTNMRMTIEGGVNEVYNVHEHNIYEMAKKVSRGMLMGARGNSGVILSQLFRGISKGLEGLDQVDSIKLAHALERGVEQAYKAVMKPVEGTILTVAKDGAHKMSLIANSRMSINEFFNEYIIELKESLERTPDLLPVLKEAGVVDSGGQGLVVIIEGMIKYLNGEEISVNEAEEKHEEVAVEEELGYCTELVLELKEEINPETFKDNVLHEQLSKIGKGVFIVKEDRNIKIHIDTFTPGDVLNISQQYGEFTSISIENKALHHEHDHEHENNAEAPAVVERPKERKEYAVVCVGTGEGLINLFKQLGADFVVSGGQSMNPSTEDFIRGFDTLNAENILVFPNNKNIILAAKQAAKIYKESKVTVIESKTLAQGYAALTMIDFTLDYNTMIEDLNETISNVETGQITYAVRDTEIKGVKITKGDFIGILDSDIVTSRRNRVDAVKDLLQKSKASERDALTIIYGKDVNAKEVNVVKKYVERSFDNLEVDVLDGGQEVYSYIFALE